MNNCQLIKEHTLALALISYYDASSKYPLENLAFGNHDLWLYYLDLHKELFNRGLSEDETSYGITNINWNGDERLLVNYVCEFDYKSLMKYNSRPWLQSIQN